MEKKESIYHLTKEEEHKKYYQLVVKNLCFFKRFKIVNKDLCHACINERTDDSWNPCPNEWQDGRLFESEKGPIYTEIDEWV